MGLNWLYDLTPHHIPIFTHIYLYITIYTHNMGIYGSHIYPYGLKRPECILCQKLAIFFLVWLLIVTISKMIILKLTPVSWTILPPKSKSVIRFMPGNMWTLVDKGELGRLLVDSGWLWLSQLDFRRPCKLYQESTQSPPRVQPEFNQSPLNWNLSSPKIT